MNKNKYYSVFFGIRMVELETYFEFENLVGKGKYDEALILADTMDEISKFCAKSRISEKRGDYGKALALAEKAIKGSNGQQHWFADIVYLYALWRLKDYEKAMGYFHFIEGYTKNFPTLIRGRIFNIIGLIYWSMGKENNSTEYFSQALEYHKRALQLRQAGGNLGETAFSHNNLGNCYLALKDYNNALNHYLQAKRLRMEIGNESDLATTLRDIGRAYFQMGNTRDAQKYFMKAYMIQTRLGNSNDIAKVLLSMAILKQSIGENAKKEFDEAYRHATQANNTILMRSIRLAKNNSNSKQ